MSVKKVGVTFNPMISLDPDLTGLAATMSAKYRLQGSTGAFTTVAGTFFEENPGCYSIPVTINVAGTYHFVIDSSEPNVPSVDSYITVNRVTTDDIFDAVADAKAVIDNIEAQVNTLDEATVNNIANQVNAVDAKLVELKGLLSDTDDAAVVSLRELLTDIQNAGSARDSVITALTNYTDDIEIMLRGDQFLTSGAANPFFGKTTHHVYDLLTATSSLLTSAITAAKDAVIADAQATRDLLSTKLNAINTIVTANSDKLGHATYGLSAIKAALANIEQNTSGGTQSIIDALEDADTGLSAIKVAVMDKLTVMDGKLDTIIQKQNKSYAVAMVI